MFSAGRPALARTLRTTGFRVGACVAVVAGVLLAAGDPGIAASAGASATPTFTWSGHGATSSSHDYDWSYAKNWVGNAAPTAPGPVNLVFPSVTCTQSQEGCGNTFNDISGLTVQTLTINASGHSCNADPDGNYLFDGDAVTLEGFSEKTNVSPGQCLGASFFYIPLSVDRTQTWQFDDGQVLFLGPINGTSPLTLSLSNQGDPDLEATDSTGSINLEGADTADVGSTAIDNGLVFIPSGASVNAGGSPTTITDSALYGLGTVGPLNTSGAGIYVGNDMRPYGVLSVDGDATLDAASEVEMYTLTPDHGTPAPNTNYPQISVSGAINLASAKFEVAANCNLVVGTRYTLVDASGGLSGLFEKAPGFGSGKGDITNGDVIQALEPPNSSCKRAGSTLPWLQFNYHDSTGKFTATVVAAPSRAAGVSASSFRRHAFPVVGHAGGRGFTVIS